MRGEARRGAEIEHREQQSGGKHKDGREQGRAFEPHASAARPLSGNMPRGLR